MPEVKIKKLETHSEYETCVAIQKEVWKHDDIDINPVHHFCIAVKTGAILLGAFVEILQDLNSLISSQPDVLLKWQSSLREVMMHYFSKGFRVVDFHYGDQCFYVLRNEKSER